MGAPSRAARITARYSLPWALCTVTAKAGSSSPSMSGEYSTILPVKVHGDAPPRGRWTGCAPMSPLNIPMPGGRAPVLPPEDVVVVLHLHHPVPRPEDRSRRSAAPPSPPRAGSAPPGGPGSARRCPSPACGWGRAPGSGRPGCPSARAGGGGTGPRWCPPRSGRPGGRGKRSPCRSSAGRAAPPVDQVGVADDGALGRLAEDLGEPHGGHRPAADQVGEQVPRPHRGQLVRVAHQHQPAVTPQGGQQGGHQRHVHHGGLVHDDRVRLQGVVLVRG